MSQTSPQKQGRKIRSLAGQRLVAQRRPSRRMTRAALCRQALLSAVSLIGLTALAPQIVQDAHAAGPMFDKNQPVTFKADRIDYNQKTNIVTLSGHVEAWQAGHVLFADRVLFDRNTNIADAVGHVVLVSPDGQVVYANYAELSQDMTNGVMSAMNVSLPQNAKLAANGGRRTEGKVNDLTRAVYTACDVCDKHPNSYPLWQLTARSATQDIEHHMIEYKDATMELYGVPFFWLPYFAHPDPTAPRTSGLLIPSAGYSNHIGAFAELPYYWVINKSTDAILTPILSSHEGLAGDVKLRHYFNFGQINVNASSGYDKGSLQGALFADGTFDLDSAWRAGFNVARASSVAYLNDYSILPNTNELESELYLEGFGHGSYSRIESSFYQGLVGSVTDSELPLVLPYASYAYKGDPDGWGGTTAINASAFNILRTTGTNTQRAAISGTYSLPFLDNIGEQWSADVHVDLAAYNADNINEFPNYSTSATHASELRGLPQFAINYRYPIMNESGSLGSQLFEPIVQLIAAPIINNNVNVTNIPNEDSYDFQFTDANLFGWNKYPGIDRLENGMRANVGFESAWYFNNGSRLDGLIGQSYRTHTDDTFAPDSGLNDNVSDIVTRLTYTPTNWLDFTYRSRFDHKTLQDKYTDTFVSAGVPALRVTAGYLYSSVDPYYYYDGSPPPSEYYTPRSEATFGLTALHAGWSFNGAIQQNIQTGKLDSTNVGIGWQNDCLGLNLSYVHTNTTIDGENGSTTVLFTVTFKTIGAIGFNAL